MLKIDVPAKEWYDYEAQEFKQTKPVSLKLEHSLLSVSKWESIHHRCFLDAFSKKKTTVPVTVDEFLDYIKCMTINDGVPDSVYRSLTKADIDKILDYIGDPMTATTINRNGKPPRGSRDTMTSEVIYFYMIANEIPFECQKWHLNRLITLIEVCGIKNGPQKKMSKKDLMARNRALNAQRRAKYNTKG